MVWVALKPERSKMSLQPDERKDPVETPWQGKEAQILSRESSEKDPFL
jgi:hypothetical protein